MRRRTFVSLLSLLVVPRCVLEGASTMPCHQERAKSCVHSKKEPPVPLSSSPLLAGYLQSSKTVLSPLLNTPLLKKPVGHEIRPELSWAVYHPPSQGGCLGGAEPMKRLKDSVASGPPCGAEVELKLCSLSKASSSPFNTQSGYGSLFPTVRLKFRSCLSYPPSGLCDLN